MKDEGSHCPTGHGPEGHAYLLIKAVIRMYDHPITPFEDRVISCAVHCSASVLEVVRGLRRLSPETEVSSCLDWIEARILSDRSDRMREGYERWVEAVVSRVRESIALAESGIRP